MSAGFRFRGAHGLTQVDERYFALSMVKTGSFSGVPPYAQIIPSGSAYSYRLTYTGDRPIFGLYIPVSAGVVGGIFSTVRSGSGVNATWTIDVVLARLDGTHTISEAIKSTIRWFAFDRPRPISGSGPGARVYDPATGNLVFDSRWRVVTMTPPAAFAAGRKYAVVGGYVGLRWEFDVEMLTTWEWQMSNRYWVDAYQCPDGSIISGSAGILNETWIAAGGGSSGEDAWAANGPLFGVDVTEFL